MALPVVFSPEADEHLEKLQSYLAKRFYPENAATYVRRLADQCISIGAAPQQGHKRDDIRPGARTVGFERRATILFEVQQDRVVILGIYYGGKQLPSSR